jgi:Domain of unknown function (DUF4377)
MMKARGIFIALTALLTGCTYTTNQAVFVAPQSVTCQPDIAGYRIVEPSNTSQTCVQISSNEAGPFYPNVISGFTPEAGNKYKLLVSAYSPPVLDASTTYTLVSVLEKIPVK